MIQEYAEDAFPGQWRHAGTRTFSSYRGEMDWTAVTAHLSRLEGWAGSRWLKLAAEMAGLANGTERPSPDPVPAGRVRLPRIATRTLGADAGSVRVARDFTIATLRRWGTAERSQDIAIVVSELLTNALRHALPGSGDTRPRRPIRLGLLQPGPCVLCAVADPSNVAPAPRAPGSLAETGRGLHIICALSDQWGYAPNDTGKVVWAMFYPRLTVSRFVPSQECLGDRLPADSSLPSPKSSSREAPFIMPRPPRRTSVRAACRPSQALDQWPAIWPPSMCRISPVMYGDASRNKMPSTTSLTWPTRPSGGSWSPSSS